MIKIKSNNMVRGFQKVLLIIVILPVILFGQFLVTLMHPWATKWLYSIEYNIYAIASKPFISMTYTTDKQIELISKGEVLPKIDSIIESHNYDLIYDFFIDDKKIYYFYNEIPSKAGLGQQQKGLILQAFDKSTRTWDIPVTLYPEEYKQLFSIQKGNGEIVLKIRKKNEVESFAIHITEYGQEFTIESKEYFDKIEDVASMQGMEYLHLFVDFTNSDAIYDPRKSNTNELIKTSILRTLFVEQGSLKVGGLKVDGTEVLIWSDTRNSSYEKVYTVCDGWGCSNSPSFTGDQKDLFILQSNDKGEWGKHILVTEDIDMLVRSYYDNRKIYFLTLNGTYGEIMLN